MEEELITGYQYSPDNGAYMGVYRFPNNKDKEEIHLPPYTTLVSPPETWPEPMHPVWNGTEWILELDDNLSGIKTPDITDKLDYVKITDLFIEELKSTGQWTARMQEKFDAAAAERAEFRGEGRLKAPVIDPYKIYGNTVYEMPPEFMHGAFSQGKFVNTLTNEISEKIIASGISLNKPE